MGLDLRGEVIEPVCREEQGHHLGLVQGRQGDALGEHQPDLRADGAARGLPRDVDPPLPRGEVRGPALRLRGGAGAVDALDHDEHALAGRGLVAHVGQLPDRDRRRRLLAEHRVVDEAGLAEADGQRQERPLAGALAGGEDAQARGVGHVDVVDRGRDRGDAGAGQGAERARVALATRERRRGGREAPGDGERGRALHGREVGVARRERQAVGLAHGAQADDLDGEEQVAGHAGDHLELLVVLPAEDRHRRPREREELGDHGGHALEVPGAVASTEGRRAGADAHARLLAGRVHGVGRGREDGGGAGARARLGVGRQRARIAGKVFVGAELSGVDEDRDDHEGRVAERLRHQGDVARVEGAHGGHQAHAEAAGAGVVAGATHGFGLTEEGEGHGRGMGPARRRKLPLTVRRGVRFGGRRWGDPHIVTRFRDPVTRRP